MTAGAVLPRCCREHRLGALEAIDRMVTLDALSLADDLVAEGWTPANARGAVEGLGRYLAARVTAAVDDGAAAWVPDVARSAIGEHRYHKRRPR